MNQPIFLRIFSGEKLVAVKQFDSTQVIFGKEARVDIDLADPDISNIHAMVEERDGQYYICDLGSKTGTKLNDNGILDEKIQSGDVIQLGNFRIEFYIGIPKPKNKPARTQMPEAPEAPSAEQIVHSEEVTAATGEIQAQDVSAAQEEEANLPPNELPEENNVPTELDEAEQPEVKASVSKDNESHEVPGLPEKNVHFDRQTITNSKGIEPSNPGVPDAAPEVSMDPAGNVEVGKNKKKRSRLTYAPPSSYSSVEEIIRPGKGMLIDVSVVWGDRVIETHRIRKAGMVSIGTHPKNDIIVPALQGMLQKQPFVQSGQSVSQVFIPKTAKGFLQLGKKQKLNFSDAEGKGRAKVVGAYYVVELQQGEMVKIDYGNRISVFVTHAGDAPPPIMYGITNSEILSIVGAIILALILFFLSNTLGISTPEEEQKEEKTVKVTKFVFNRKEPIPKKVVKVSEEQKTPRRVETPSKKVQTNRKEKLKGNPGKAAELRANKNRIRNKMKLAAEKKGTPSKKKTRRVGKRSAKKGSDQKAKNKQVDLGLASFLAKSGTRDRLDKVSKGKNSVLGASKEVTGAGGGSGGTAVDSGLKNISKGGNGTETIGLQDVDTKGKGGGLGEYGEGGFGQKGTSKVDIGGQGTEFVGTIDKEAVRRVIIANKAQIRACYEEELNKNFGLYGKVTVTWDIQAQGRVGKAFVKSSTLKNSNVEKCIVRRLKTWRFPEPPSGATARVSYPFVFSAR